MQNPSELKPIYGMDYFLFVLSSQRKIYNKYGLELERETIAQTKFGQVKLNLDDGYYNEEKNETNQNRNNHP